MCGYTGDLIRDTEKKEECAECYEVSVKHIFFLKKILNVF